MPSTTASGQSSSALASAASAGGSTSGTRTLAMLDNSNAANTMALGLYGLQV